MDTERGTISELTDTCRFKTLSVLSPVIPLFRCCMSKKRRDNMFEKQFGQVKEAQRKFDKVRDITHILRSV